VIFDPTAGPKIDFKWKPGILDQPTAVSIQQDNGAVTIVYGGKTQILALAGDLLGRVVTRSDLEAEAAAKASLCDRCLDLAAKLVARHNQRLEQLVAVTNG